MNWNDLTDEEQASHNLIPAAFLRQRGNAANWNPSVERAWWKKQQRAQQRAHDDALAKAIRDEATARKGTNPKTGAWWPAWKLWKPTGGPIAQFKSRFTSATGRAAGQSRSWRKREAARRNGWKGAPYGARGGRRRIDTDDTQPRNPQRYRGSRAASPRPQRPAATPRARA